MAAATIYPLLDVLWWNLIGGWMDFIFHHVSSTYFRRNLLPKFGTTAPQWWKDSWGASYNWYHHLTDGVPDGAFAWYYRHAARDRYNDWVRKISKDVARWWDDNIYTLIGTIKHGFTDFSDWINTIWGRVGTYVPWWTDTLAEGIDFLYSLLPYDIQRGLTTWYDKFVDWYDAAISWAQSRYEAARVWVTNTGSWLVSGYNTVRAWYDSAHAWLDDFRYNAYARITAWLGTAWSAWVGVRYGIVDFYNNVWVPFGVTLHDFLADPLGWLYDRVEDELVRRW